MFSQVPIRDAIARHTSTWHHLTCTFARVCCAWRDAAHEETCRRLDATLEEIRSQHIERFHAYARTHPFVRAVDDGIVDSFSCDNCGHNMDCSVESVWFATNDPCRKYDLCSDCHASYDGPLRFVDFVHGADGPYYMAFFQPAPLDSDDHEPFSSGPRVCARMQVPRELRWPRNLVNVRSDQLLRAAQLFYDATDGDEAVEGAALRTCAWEMAGFGAYAVWIDAATDTLRCTPLVHRRPRRAGREEDDDDDADDKDDYTDGPSRHAPHNILSCGSECWARVRHEPFFAEPLSQLECDGSFNVLDWIPVAVELKKVKNRLSPTVVQHVVCANPSNRRFYGCRASIVDTQWWPWRCPAVLGDTEVAVTQMTTVTSANAVLSAAAVALRAYHIWEATGRDDAVANWLQAERELRDDVRR